MAIDPGPDFAPEKKGYPWRKALLTFAGTIGYMIPLFWLWNRARWPEGFGITITAHGKAGLIENWYYSYLLIERPSLIDDVIFLYMWAPVVGFAGWLGLTLYSARKGNGGGLNGGNMHP